MFCLKFSTINKGIGVFVTFTVSSNHIWKPTKSAETGLVLCQLVCREYDCRLCRFWTHKGPTSWESWESSAWAGVRAPGSTIPGKGEECSVHIMKTFCLFYLREIRIPNAKVTPKRSYDRKQCFYEILPTCSWVPQFLPSDSWVLPSPPMWQLRTSQSKAVISEMSNYGCIFTVTSKLQPFRGTQSATTASSLPLLVDRHDGGFTATPCEHYGSKYLLFL